MIVRRLAATSLAALLLAGIVPTAVLAAGPAADDHTVATVEDQSTTVTFSATDPETDPIDSFDILGGGPSDGSLSSFSAIDCVSDAPMCTQTATYTPGPDTNGQDSFDYTATAGADTSSAATIQVNVAAVNDAPDFTKGADVSVPKNSSAKSVTGWATGISKGPSDESGQTVNFLLAPVDTSLFAAGPSVSAGGTLTFTPATGKHGSTDVDVTLHDNGGTANGGENNSATRTFTISITDTPTAQNDSVTIDEDSGMTNVDVLSNDDVSPDVGGGLTVVSVGSAAKGTATVHSGGGSVDYVPDDDANGADSFSYTAQDDNGGTDVATVTVHVTPVNDPPSFSKGPNVTVAEDSGQKTATGWATAIFEGAANESAQTVSFEITGNSNPGLFDIAPAVSGVGTLTFTPADDAVGSSTITLVAKDSGGDDDTSAPQSFTITVTGVNDAPAFTKGPNQTVLEDAGQQVVGPWATGVSPGPGDESGQGLTFEVTDNSNEALFSDGPSIDADGELSYTPAANAHGAATIQVRLVDDGGTAGAGDNTSDPQSFTITVTSVNDAPSFTKGTDIQTPEATTSTLLMFDNWATDVAAGPADESGQAVNFMVSNDNNALFSTQPSISADGTLSFKPLVHGTGTATVTVSLHDDAGTANGGEDTSPAQTFLIDVSGTNDPPVAGNDIATAHLPGSTTINVLGNDSGGPGESGDPVKITSVTQGARGQVTIATDGLSLSYDPAGCSTGTDTFSYTIKDTNGTGLSATGSVFVNVSSPSAYPAADGPRPAFVTGSTIGSTTPVKLSWCGLTSGTTMKAWKLDQSRNGGGYTTAVASTTATSNTRSLAVSPTSYQFRARITDKKNHTAFGTGPKFKIVRTQDTSTSIAYSSGWSKSSKGSPSGGFSHATTGKSKTATMTFTGRGFAIVGTLGKGHGSFSVYVDGAKVAAISTKSKKTHDRRVLYARTTANGTHTIKVVTSGNGRVDLDAILTFIAG